ncbi:galactocerebrosidase precursor [Paragonimus heterotremus]|uniref:galactosylceramidase n=1 Tax=Paragonimus heterotremus TaxID=100268 RepID=A0A8J4TJT9_9TREM|nr:galactocerebrosidase precursor [Paragonimus heterotremus]
MVRWEESLKVLGLLVGVDKLLANYKEQQLNEILDYLFKPGYGASLTQLKVEIGGDSQSTEGTEASHMHTASDKDCTRGYESWLIQKAKKINPNIEIHGLPWAFPGWLGNNPYERPERTADYIVQWVKCMKGTFQVQVDYIGIWNEKLYNVDYIKILRKALNKARHEHVKIIVADGGWEIANDIQKDAKLRDAIHAIGAHYPGTWSSNLAQSLNLPLWASEDYSTYNNDVGSGCWARILNQNYVNGMMTSTIAWNLVASYFDKLPFPKCSLMTADEPWSGHYTVNGPVWVTAHTTHFTQPGWTYLKHGTGVGHLPNGGSYVSLVSPDKSQLTIVIETMTHDHSLCIRPALPPYTVKPQTVTLQLAGTSFGNLSSFHVYRTRLRFGKNEQSEYFKYVGEVKAMDQQLTLELGIDELYTLSTIKAKDYSFPEPPKSDKFPLPYKDDFQVRNTGAIREPEYLTPQVGYFELVPENEDEESPTVLQQMALNHPIDWCNVGSNPIAIMGYQDGWEDVRVKSTAMMPSTHGTDSLFVAARVAHGGCDHPNTPGIFGWVDFKKQEYRLTSDLTSVKVLASGHVDLKYDMWYELDLLLKQSKAIFSLNQKVLAEIEEVPVKEAGFVGLGSGGFGYARYANFTLSSTKNLCQRRLLSGRHRMKRK